MGACKVDPDASPEFSILRKHWKKKGHPSIDSDLADAYKEIAKNVEACHGNLAQRTSAFLKEAEPKRDLALYKYRHKNKAAREGASGGWRFYAVLDKETNTLYPIIVYPHKAWTDANDDLIKKCIEELIGILRQRDLDSN